MFVFKIDALIQGNIGFINRAVYLASCLKKSTEIIFCLIDKPDCSRFFQKNGISWCLDESFLELKNRQIKSIIWDKKCFQENDKEMLKWSKENNINTIQISDLGMNQQPVDFTIDSSLFFMIAYGDEKQGLFGPEYVILHHKYRHFNRIKRSYQKRIKKVFLGLSEAVDYRQLRKIIEFITSHNFKLKIHTAFNLKKSQKKILRQLYPSVSFIGKVESLARSLYEADISIISPGDLAYKAAACGTPSIYVCSNKDHEPVADSLEKQGLGYKIECLEDLSGSELIKKISNLSFEKRLDMGRSGRELVDAKGIYRIIDFFKKMDII